ncbi:MAG: Transcription initiation protein spt3 [Watsoniomyces obsoletus]|nr:MAG: Transcription initiation protein spt3 [Watsoniomyces obsoletus]
MSGEQFSNAETGSKAADPYKEKNYQNDLSVKDKVEGLIEFIEGCKFGMMTTRQAQTGLLVSRCMALAGKDHGIDLIFHTNTESGKTDELHNDPHINIAFINSSGEWASISGEASVLTDRETVKKYYSRALKAWIGDLGDGKHDGGPEDPRVGIIQVKTVTATYAVSHRSAVGRGAQIAKGVITGDTPDVNRVREIHKEEIAEYKRLSTAQ